MTINKDEYRNQRWYIQYHHEKCTLCGRTFLPFQMSLLGKDSEGNYQTVCGVCKEKVGNLHPIGNNHHWSFESPEPEARLWRFMDLAKFVSLLSTRKLYFTRLSDFADVYEGAVCSAKGKDNYEQQDHFIRRIVTAADMKSLGMNPTEEEVEMKTEESRKNAEKNRRLMRDLTYVNCWSMNEVESEAMWRLYSRDMRCGVAIQTTFERLFFSLDAMSNFEMGKVNYVNFDENFVVRGGEAVWYKRKSLEYEHEVRAIVQKIPNSNAIFSNEMAVDLDKLIERVVISPEAEMWFYNVIHDLCRKYDVHCPIEWSEIQVPVYY